MPESEALSVEPAEDTILDALFSTATLPPPSPRESDTRHRNSNEDEY